MSSRHVEFAARGGPRLRGTLHLPGDSVAPLPLLMVLSKHDDLTITDIELDAFHAAREPKQLVLLDGDQFGACLESFDAASAAERDFVRRHL